MTTLDAVWERIAATPIAAFVREATWAYPALETAHVLGLGLLVGAIFALDLRLLGWHRDLPVDRMAHHLLPLVWIGFAVNAASGVLLFMSDAVEFATNPALQVKLALIGLAGLNALWFQLRVAPSLDAWRVHAKTPAAARGAALVSIALWLAVITAGRMIAYIK